MFNKMIYFFKKYKWSPLFNLKKSFDPPFDLRQSTWPPNFQEPLLLVKNDTSLRKINSWWPELLKIDTSANALSPLGVYLSQVLLQKVSPFEV